MFSEQTRRVDLQTYSTVPPTTHLFTTSTAADDEDDDTGNEVDDAVDSKSISNPTPPSPAAASTSASNVPSQHVVTEGMLPSGALSAAREDSCSGSTLTPSPPSTRASNHRLTAIETGSNGHQQPLSTRASAFSIASLISDRCDVSTAINCSENNRKRRRLNDTISVINVTCSRRRRSDVATEDKVNKNDDDDEEMCNNSASGLGKNNGESWPVIADRRFDEGSDTNDVIEDGRKLRWMTSDNEHTTESSYSSD